MNGVAGPGPSYSYDSLRAAVAVVRDPDIGWVEHGPAAQMLAAFVADYLDHSDEIDGWTENQ